MRGDRIIAQDRMVLLQEIADAERSETAEMRVGISTRSNTLRSKTPMTSSSAVTTAQIVSTMKRGENGSSSVSMAPLRQINFCSAAA